MASLTALPENATSPSPVPSRERALVRELAAAKAEIGNLPRQRATSDLWRRMNQLEVARPLVWINELPWHELEATCPGELTSRCQDPRLKPIETSLRRELFQWKHFPADMVVEPVWYNPLVGGPRGVYADYGIREDAHQKPGCHDVCYRPVIHTAEDIERITMPRVWVDREQTAVNHAFAQEIFGDILPVLDRGLVHQWHSPWDQIIRWYGIEQLYEDMVENPDFVHRLMGHFMDIQVAVVEAQQALGLLDLGNGNYRVGSGGFGMCDELPATRGGIQTVAPAHQWGCSNAQIFSEVSASMHEEFSLQYERRLLSKYGLAYYGCCEPLHFKLGILKSLPNLRKVSMSPWVNLRQAADLTHRDLVLSFKPNPAHMATDIFNEDTVRALLGEAAHILRDQCAEFIFKDISTIRGDVKRLERWEQIAMETVGAR